MGWNNPIFSLASRKPLGERRNVGNALQSSRPKESSPLLPICLGTTTYVEGGRYSLPPALFEMRPECGIGMRGKEEKRGGVGVGRDESLFRLYHLLLHLFLLLSFPLYAPTSPPLLHWRSPFSCFPCPGRTRQIYVRRQGGEKEREMREEGSKTGRKEEAGGRR